MRRAKAFLYVCAGVLLLAWSYHLGARNAGAQQGSTISGFAAAGGTMPGEAVAAVVVMTPNGDVYTRTMHSNPSGSDSLYCLGNFWKAPLVPVRQGGAQPSRNK